MAQPLSQQPTSQALRAEEIQKIRDRHEFNYQTSAAEIISLDSDLRIFQRFNELRIFVILRHQHRLAALAAEMQELKKKVGNNSNDRDIWGDRTLDSFTKEIESALRDYDTAVLAQTRVDKFRSPPQSFLESFLQVCASRIPKLNIDLGVKTSSRAEIADSLAAIATREKSWTHRFIDQNEFLRTHLAKTVVHKAGWTVRTYSESSIRRAELIFMNVTFNLMLISPIIALSFVDSSSGKLAIVLSFLLLGAILTSGIITRANNTGLGVLAGYGAILVFFLGVKLDISA